MRVTVQLNSIVWNQGHRQTHWISIQTLADGTFLIGALGPAATTSVRLTMGGNGIRERSPRAAPSPGYVTTYFPGFSVTAPRPSNWRRAVISMA
jgi:hypothetical protein